MERRLAAILAADVVGYSRLMGADETGALAAFGQFRAKLFAPAAAIADPHGSIVKLMCDGGLGRVFWIKQADTCKGQFTFLCHSPRLLRAIDMPTLSHLSRQCW